MDQQFDWLQSNAFIDYPFERVQPQEIKAAFVEALIIDGTASGPVRLNSISLNGVLNAIALSYADSGLSFFNGTEVISKMTFGSYTVVQVSEESSNKHVLLTLNIVEPFTAEPQAVFVTRCMEPQPARVASVTVYDMYNVPHILTGDITLAAGKNTVLTPTAPVSTDGHRLATPVTFDVIPGAGQGLQENDCVNDGYIRSINGVGPDEYGRLLLNANDCYRIWRPINPLTSQVVKYALKLANGCETCCDCDDYGTVYNAMTRVYNTGRDTGKMMAALGGKSKDANNSARSDMLKRSKRRFLMLLRPTPGNILGVQVTYLNNRPSKISLDAMDMRLKVTCAVDGEIAQQTIYIYNSQYETWKRLELCEMFPDLRDCSGTQEYPQFYQRPKEYEEILGIQYAVTYFDLMFPDAVDGEAVTVELESVEKRWLYENTSDYKTTQTATLFADMSGSEPTP